MVEIVPEGSSGNVKVEHFEVPQVSLRMLFRPSEYVTPGKYARLVINGQIMMTDTDMERTSNRTVLLCAHGHVLVAGLGLGMILHPILAKSSVETVTVLEKNPDVIKLIEPTVRHPKLTVVQADVFDWTPPPAPKFNTVYFDIWAEICGNNLKDMAFLHRRYGRWTDTSDPGRFVDSWQRDFLKRQQVKSRRNSWTRSSF